MLVRPLSNDDKELSLISQWVFDEWGYVKPACTVESIRDGYRKRVGSQALPLTLVAQDGGVVGTASLVACDLPGHPELKPWLSCLYVEKAKRGQGVGERLLEAIVQETTRLGFPTCYLYTDKAEGYYARLGWEPILRETIAIGPIVVMKRTYEHSLVMR